MKRDVQIELFRTFCMFGVCLLHALTQGGFIEAHRGLDNVLMPSVVGFVFISGYYGIRLKMRSILKLIFCGLYCTVVVAILQVVMGVGAFDGQLVLVALRRLQGYWFLWCYLALMLVAPAFEPLFEIDERQRPNKRVAAVVLPVLFLAFVWSYAAERVPFLRDYLPHVNGFGGYTLLTFVGVYLAARTSRYYCFEKLIPVRALWVLAALSGIACWIGMGHYHSPFALLLAGSMFFLFKRMKLGPMLSRMSIGLAPSMFSVYLIHTNDVGFSLLRNAESFLFAENGWPYYLVCCLLAVVVFAAGVLLDMPRRVFQRFVHDIDSHGA